MKFIFAFYALMLAALVVAISTLPGRATTVRLYTPGGAPCGDACTYEWAVKEFGVPVVPEGQWVALVVPRGAITERVSYAKDGVPYWTSETMMFEVEAPARGYSFLDENGETLWMVQLYECGNWEVVRFEDNVTQVFTSSPGSVLTTPEPPAHRFTPSFPSTQIVTEDPCFPFDDCDPEPPCEINCEPPCVVDCEPPPVVPLPASGWLLLTGLAVLFRTLRQGPRTRSRTQ
jgi:hypothetical protein